MLPKLHKSKELNNIILAKNNEYINVDKILTIEGRPIVAGPCYHTSVVSQILHVIMEPTLSFIKHILKDSFDFIDRIDTQCTVNTILNNFNYNRFNNCLNNINNRELRETFNNKKVLLTTQQPKNLK